MKRVNIKTCCVLIAISLLITLSGQAQDLPEVQRNAKPDSIVQVAFGSVARKDLLGGVSAINVPELLKKNYGTYSLDNLQSFVGGYTGNVWGQEALILVDGIPR